MRRTRSGSTTLTKTVLGNPDSLYGSFASDGGSTSPRRSRELKYAHLRLLSAFIRSCTQIVANAPEQAEMVDPMIKAVLKGAPKSN